jgi:hypothetical protein
MRFNTTNSDGNEQRALFNVGGASDPFSITGYKGDASTVGMVLNAGGVSYFNGGNVGIGTSSPASHAKLHIAGDAYAFLTLQATNSGGRQYELFSYAADESFHLYDRTAEAYRMTVDETGDVKIVTGNLVIGTAGKGIDFSAQTSTTATNAATLSDGEVLNHYEEGTWTPVTIGSTGGTFTQSTGLGSYIRIGKLVHLTFYCGATGLNDATGLIYITGLPYSAGVAGAANSSITTGSCMFDNVNLASGYTHLSPYMYNGSSYIQFYQSGDNTSWTTLPVEAGFTVIGSMTYRAA